MAYVVSVYFLKGFFKDYLDSFIYLFLLGHVLDELNYT